MQPVDSRQIGPVTTAAGAGVAAAGILCWVLSLFGIDVPTEVQTYIGILLVVIAGWMVKPAGKRAAL